jgi:hypothetical protein
VELNSNDTHEFLVYADGVNLLRDNTEILIEESKSVGPEGNAEKANYILMSRLQNAG